MPKHKDVYSALHAAQVEMEPARKDGTNPFYHSKYTTLNELINHTRGTLDKHGLAIFVTYYVGSTGDIAVLNCKHLDSDTKIESCMSLLLEQKNNHAQGSACTYTSRYLLEGLLMLPREDDDGNASCKTPSSQTQKAPPPKKNPLLDIKNPQKLGEAITNAHAKFPPDKSTKGWADRIEMIDQVIKMNGWEDDEFIGAIYPPVKQQVNLHLQAEQKL